MFFALCNLSFIAATSYNPRFPADLAGGPGRAVDAALKLGYEFDNRWTIQAGYRTVEGGANVTAVYNFAWIHYSVISVIWKR